MKKQSAGLIVYRKANSNIEVLIAHMGGPFHATKDLGHWSIPKGEYQEGEDPKAVAEREFKEELGIDAPEGEWLDLGEVEYKAGGKKGKIVTAWAVEGNVDASKIKSNSFEIEWPPRSGITQKFPEIDRAGYFQLHIAAQKLIPAQIEFLKRLAEKLNENFKSGQKQSEPNQPSLF